MTGRLLKFENFVAPASIACAEPRLGQEDLDAAYERGRADALAEAAEEARARILDLLASGLVELQGREDAAAHARAEMLAGLRIVLPRIVDALAGAGRADRIHMMILTEIERITRSDQSARCVVRGPVADVAPLGDILGDAGLPAVRIEPADTLSIAYEGGYAGFDPDETVRRIHGFLEEIFEDTK